MTRTDVQFYSAHAKALKHTQQNKILKFLANKCVEYSTEKKCFLVKPLEGYNKTTYEITKEGEDFVCNCQGYTTTLRKEGKGNCSHVGCVWELLKRGHRERRQERACEGLRTLFSLSGGIL